MVQQYPAASGMGMCFLVHRLPERLCLWTKASQEAVHRTLPSVIDWEKE